MRSSSASGPGTCTPTASTTTGRRTAGSSLPSGSTRRSCARITEAGSIVEADQFIDRRNRQTRAIRWEKLDVDLIYDASALDREVFTPDQVRTFRDRLFTEIFPGRREVPKTLIYAKDDSHADDVVQIVREEFGKGTPSARRSRTRPGRPASSAGRSGRTGRRSRRSRINRPG